ncbi:hypothetical protein ACEQ6A_20660 [Rhizobium brockwellii]|uniref:hypothetical protein n=1 Tax=Rhizobium brockwellii TaxID=3019932 RepID=UPI003F9CECF2
MRRYDEDEGLNVIRLDGLLRVNAGISSGDHIEIRKADARPATKVVLAPAQKNPVLQGSGEARCSGPSSVGRWWRAMSFRPLFNNGAGIRVLPIR